MQKKLPTFPFFRSIKSRMIERYIFNFRIRPEKLAARLPVRWLEPQVVNGWSAVSFCVLWLDRLTVTPIPPLFRFSTLSCAYRIGVTDISGTVPEPSVYITDRWADLPLIARLAPWILLDTVPLIRVVHEHAGAESRLEMSHPGGQPLFSARARPSSKGLQSEVFESMDAFSSFIKNGVSSYAPAVYLDAYSKVDLAKEDVSYEALEGEVDYSELSVLWPETSMVLDSVVRAKGAAYKWTYRGLWVDEATK